MEETETMREAGKELTGLLAVMKALRAPDGCPWDRAQDHESLRTYLLQETYEVLDAIEAKDDKNLCEELGDLLLQIVFHAQIAEENSQFTMKDVAEGIKNKMIARHPFVFQKDDNNAEKEMSENWEEQKFRKKKRKNIFSGLPKSLPSLLLACIMQSRIDSVCHTDAKSRPCRLSELQSCAIRQREESGDSVALEFILGYLLFETVRFVRTCGMEPETALHRFNSIFAERFGALEDSLREDGKPVTEITEATLQNLEAEIAAGTCGTKQEFPAV